MLVTGYAVGMVTFYITKIITTCSLVIGNSFDTIIIGPTDKQW